MTPTDGTTGRDPHECADCGRTDGGCDRVHTRDVPGLSAGDRARWRELADAATGGPWEATYGAMSDDRSRGDWMQTFTGRRFYPLDPNPAEVHPEDIAHALSLLCRYNGHVERFYSVAEHCVLMSRAVAPEHALWALLHDATEAYVGDMIRPLKRSMLDYQRAEYGVMCAIAARFGLSASDVTPDGFPIQGTMPPEVKDADNRILLTERNALMRPSGHAWAVEDLTPLPVTIQGWTPAQAEIEYALRLEELTR